MPRRNHNVRPAHAKRVKHTNAGPRLRAKRARTRRYVIDPHTGEPTVAWKTRRRAA